MTSTLAANPAVRAVGLALIWFVVQGAIAAAVIGGLLAALRHASAALRYCVACAGLAAMGVMPVATALRHWTPATPVVAGAPDSTPQAAMQPPSQDASQDLAERRESPRLAIDRAAPVVVLGWMTGVGVLTVQLLGGWVQLVRIRRHARPPHVREWVTTVAHLATRLRIRRTVRLLESTLVGVPVMMGWLRPVILVPVGVFAGLTPDQIGAILAHELAHVRRGDYLVNAFQRVIEIVLFYHPAVWWVSARVRREREHCCDDLAAPLSLSPLTYARALLALEERRARGPALAMAATGTGLFARIRRIVDPTAPAEPALSKGAAMPIVLSLVALALTGGISFGHGAAVASSNLHAATSMVPSPARVSPAPPPLIGVAQPTSASSVVPTGALAPQSSGSIRGTFTDQEGGHMPGVTVTVEPVSAVGPPRTVVSDKAGQFAVTNLPGGTYLLTATLPGFRKDERRVEVAAGADVTETIQLRVGSIMEAVTVNPAAVEVPPTGQAGPARTSVPDLLETAKQASDSGRVADAESALRQALALLQAQHPQPPASVGPVAVGGSIKEPKRLVSIEPVYPKTARDAGIQGVVVIEATIDRDGTVADAVVLKGVPELNDAALAAVRQWVYSPTLLDGVPVQVQMTLTVAFTLR